MIIMTTKIDIENEEKVNEKKNQLKSRDMNEEDLITDIYSISLFVNIIFPDTRHYYYRSNNDDDDDD